MQARSRGVDNVDIDNNDYYWTILSGDWLNFQEKPEPAVGSLEDDILELKKLLAEPSRASSVDLERLSAILKFLSET
jgi:hypothetical protein